MEGRQAFSVHHHHHHHHHHHNITIIIIPAYPLTFIHSSSDTFVVFITFASGEMSFRREREAIRSRGMHCWGASYSWWWLPTPTVVCNKVPMYWFFYYECLSHVQAKHGWIEVCMWLWSEGMVSILQWWIRTYDDVGTIFMKWKRRSRSSMLRYMYRYVGRYGVMMM